MKEDTLLASLYVARRTPREREEIAAYSLASEKKKT